MKKIFFITGNKAKFEWAKKIFKKFMIEITQKKIKLVEPKEFIVEVSLKFKMEEALKRVGPPLIVEEGSLLISALNGFPGTFVKDVIRTLGVDRLCKIMDGEKNREICFRSALGFVNEDNTQKIFVFDEKGRIPKCPRGKNLHGFNDIMKIFIPDGYEKTFAEMDGSEFEEYENKIKEENHYASFARWFLGVKK